MKNFFFLLCSGWNVKERFSMEKLGWKYQNPGLTSYIFFDRLGFGFRCFGERVAILAQFHILGFLSFSLPTGLQNVTYQTTLFFNITLPLPNHMDIFLNCFFRLVLGCEVRFADDMIWFFFHTISVSGSPLEEDKIWMWPFGPVSRPIFHHCLFFLLHFTVMINISALNSCFPCAWWQIEDGMPRPCQRPKSILKKATSILLREFRISGTKKALCLTLCSVLCSDFLLSCVKCLNVSATTVYWALHSMSWVVP
jgi:hypothetical protein